MLDSNGIPIIPIGYLWQEYILALFEVIVQKFGYGECIIVFLQSVVYGNNNLQLQIIYSCN